MSCSIKTAVISIRGKKEIYQRKIGGLTLVDRHILRFYYHGVKNIIILDENKVLSDWEFSRDYQDLNLSFSTDATIASTYYFLAQGNMIFNKKILNLLESDCNQDEDKTLIRAVVGNKKDGASWTAASKGIKLAEKYQWTGIALLPKSSFDGEKLKTAGAGQFLEEKLAHEEVKILENRNSLFFHVINNRKDASDTGRLLFYSLRKPQDGIIARTLNRPLSLPVSRLLAPLPFTPNQLSILNGLLAVASVFFLVWGNSLLGLSFYLSGFLGGLFMQLCSIYDGCDGEIARVKYQYTHFGDWLDTIVDDITNCIYFAGIAVWAYYYTGQQRFIYMGIAAFVGQWIANYVMYYYLIKIAGTGNNQDYQVGFSDEEDGGVSGRVLNKVKYLTKRDFHLFMFFVLSLFGVLHIGAYLIFAFAVSAGVIFSIQHIQLLVKGAPQNDQTDDQTD
ncbi:MAG: CDP-alcohol phosphatidyltransferase family protein [Deltaproteobacteria bacterium]|jgi:phosphatidylglycerophosphate synthase|nr:CDP-alcohol phosphatidyltransferase family protein [Deltaproteobacteria bacterium]